jgi:hypothetical protein
MAQQGQTATPAGKVGSEQMPHRRHRGFAGRAAIVLAVGFTFATTLSAPAAAQGLLGAIFGALGGNPRPSVRTYAPAYADPSSPFDRAMRPSASDDGERPRAESNGISTGASGYCVRMCDGRYFPVPRAANGASIAPAKVCHALCPAAETKVFSGSNVAWASAADGTRYSDLDNAYAFREKIVQDCTCTGHGPGGLAQIDIEHDPTLRNGDVVMTTQGAMAFKGAGQFPYKTADFTPIGSYSRVSDDLQRKLSELKVDPTAQSAIPVQKIATAQDQPVAKQKPRRARVQAVESGRSDPWGWFTR